MAMKTYRSVCKIFLCTLLLRAGMDSHAQEPQAPYQPVPVVVSQTIDTVAGKAYRVHVVQRGHTLYSICKAYRTSADSLLKDSPENQVQADEFIYVPLRLLPDEDPARFTKFAGKRPWAVVFLYKDVALQVETQPEPVTDESKGRRRRERKEERRIEPDTVVAATDTLAPLVEDSVFIMPRPQAKAAKDSLRVSLLLPLYSNTPQDKKAYIYLPFFEGATVAWQEFIDPGFFIPPVDDTILRQDTLAATAQDVMPDTSSVMADTSFLSDTSRSRPFLHLRIYDLTRSACSLDSILNDDHFRLSDAVIATAFVDQFQILDSVSKEWEMPLVHPISERDSMSAGNPYFIQLSASYGNQISHIADFIGKHHSRARILIISDSTAGEARKAGCLQSLLPGSEHLYFNAATVAELEKLGESKQKTVIVPFYRKEITAVKTMLPLRQTKGNISIIAPNVWLDYPTVDLDYYIQNHLVVYHTFCNGARNSGFKEFSKKYYFLYHGLPNTLAYQGYKASSWLFEMLSGHNADFVRHLIDMEQKNENAPYLFHERDLGGFENTDVHFVRVTENGLEHIR